MSTAVLSIPIPKAGRNIGITQEEFDNTPKEVYEEIMRLGWSALLNKATAGKAFTGQKDMDEDELKASQEEAFKAVEQRKAELLEGKIKKSRAKTAGAKASREEQKFVLDGLRADIKAAFKAAGKKLPAKASAITQAAKDYGDDNPERVAELRKEYAELKSKSKPIEVSALSEKLKGLLDKADSIKPKVPPKRAKKKADDEDTASETTVVAATSGKVKPRKGADARH